MNTIIESVIQYLNEKTGNKYNPEFRDTQALINNLIQIGYSEDDFKKVIDKKYNEWNGTQFAVYLRPSTLFGDKFENYLKNDKRNNKNRVQQLFDAVQSSKQFDWKLDKK